MKKLLILLFFLCVPLSILADPPYHPTSLTKIGACRGKDGNIYRVLSTLSVNHGSSGYFLKQNKKLYYGITRKNSDGFNKYSLYVYDCVKKKETLLLTEKSIDDLLENSNYSYGFLHITPEYYNGNIYISIAPLSVSAVSNDYPDSILNFQIDINWIKRGLTLTRMNNGNLGCYDNQQDTYLFCGEIQPREKQINIQF